MSIQRPLRLLPIVGLALLLMFVLERLNAVDSRTHSLISGDLRRLKELDAQLNQSVLKVRYRILLDYGPLVEDLGEVTRIHSRLLNPPHWLSSEGRDAIITRVKSDETALDEKSALIERFKSRNSIYNNSLSFTPFALTRMAERLREAGTRSTLADRLDAMCRDVLLAQGSIDTTLNGPVRAQALALRRELTTLPLDLRHELTGILVHIDVLLATRPEVNDILRRILEVPTGQHADELLAAYEQWHTQALSRAGRIRFVLYPIALLLLLTVVFAIVQLRRSARMVESANELLEQRVDERTMELHTSMERYRSLVEGTNAIPWEMDHVEKQLLYVAPQAVSVLGVSPEIVEKPDCLRGLIHPEDAARVREFEQGVVEGTWSEDHCDYRLVVPERGVVHVRTVAAPDSARPDRILRGVILDITQQTQLEQELRQSQKLESVGRLASGIAHEINTPIQFVTDSLHFVRDASADLISLIGHYKRVVACVEANEPAESAMAAAAAAEREADFDYIADNLPPAAARALDGLSRVTTIVRAMKAFAHPDTAEMSTIDLNRAITDTLTVAKSEFKYVADLDLDLGDLPPVRCYAGELNQVVLNIVVNAAHAIADVVRESSSRGRIGVRTRLENDVVRIDIADTGGGIPMHVRDHVFEPFFTTKEVGKGTGQGLALARGVVVDKHGGKLTFETEIGRGTTFTILLPHTGGGAQSQQLAA